MLSALLFQAMNPLVCDAHASHQECRRQNQEEGHPLANLPPHA
jgi:hypothetical protein